MISWPNWSGKSLILEGHWPSGHGHLVQRCNYYFTDASGTIGWGAHCKWLQGHWSEAQLNMDITWKELFAIVMAVHTWGSLWQKQKILLHCDNQAVVSMHLGIRLNLCKKTMASIQLLYFVQLDFQIAGTNNKSADCFQQDTFR